MGPDDVVSKYADRKSNLRLSLLTDDEDGGRPWVLIEGPKRALHLLADILKAVAEDQADDGFQMAPDGPGSFHFSPQSEFGVYIHRLDE